MTRAIAFYDLDIGRTPSINYVSSESLLLDSPSTSHNISSVRKERCSYFSDSINLPWTVDVARSNSLYGLCLCVHWNSKKTIVNDHDVAYWLKRNIPDFPFCLCLTHALTLSVDSRGTEALSTELERDWESRGLESIVLPCLTNLNYIQISNKPLIVVWHQSQPDNLKDQASYWRDLCRGAGIGEIFLAVVYSTDSINPSLFGFDAVIESPPVCRQDSEKYALSYVRLMKSSSHRYLANQSYTFFPTVTLPLDLSLQASHRHHYLITYGASIESYERWLIAACESAKTTSSSHPEHDLIFIHSWNKLTDKSFGNSNLRSRLNYIRVTHNVLTPIALDATKHHSMANDFVRQAIQPENYAVIIHAYYLDIFSSFLPLLHDCFDLGLRLYITCPHENVAKAQKLLAGQCLPFHIFPYDNRGRDILPFLQVLPHVIEAGHRYVIKIHTKRSTHRADGDKWLADLTKDLIGREALIAIERRFAESSRLGIIGPSGNVLSTNLYLGSNLFHIKKLLRRLDISYEAFLRGLFVAGSMYAAKAEALLPLCECRISPNEFEDEAAQVDGTIAHAIERIVSVAAEKNGFTTESVDPELADDFQYAVQTTLAEAQMAEVKAEAGACPFDPTGIPTSIALSHNNNFTGWIEQPSEGQRVSSFFELRGWCFIPRENPICALMAR